MRPHPASRDAIVLPGAWQAIGEATRLVGRSVSSLSAADPGHFGPGSVSWRIFSHASYGVSGIAAVLMQALHPIAIAAVDQQSAFRTDAWRRARLTAAYVFTITFGARPVADAAAAKVRRIHEEISGVDPATGLVHRADEPELLLWVHSVHTEYALRGYETFVRALSAGDADRFVAEQVAAAALVGLDRAIVPATRTALRAHLAAIPGLGVTAPAADFARMMLGARMPPTMRPFWALHVAGAASLLPPDVCRAYRLPRWARRGRLGRALIGVALRSIDTFYLLFAPVRRARARLKQVERAARAEADRR
jgi:uncharacterized protein (DUF2236 family)